MSGIDGERPAGDRRAQALTAPAPSHLRISLAQGLLLVLLGAGIPGGAMGQDPGSVLARVEPAPLDTTDARCQVISQVDVRNHSLFDPATLEGHRFSSFLGLANWVHIRTREGFLRDQLLFEEGECYDPFVISESARLIRDLDFIARVQATPALQADSTWEVTVETWDEWSTQVGLDFDVENEFQFKGFFVAEENLAGRGVRLAFRYRAFRERDDRSFALSTANLLGTRATASIGAGTTRTGHSFAQEVSYPFTSESARFSLQTRVFSEDQEFSYITGRQDSVSHVLLPLRHSSGYMNALYRLGEPGALVVVGAGVDWLDQRVAGSPRQVARGDFEESTIADDSLALSIDSQNSSASWVRLGATIGLRRLRFTTGVGLDRVSGTQTIALGTEVLFTAGHTIGHLRGSPGWAFVRGRAFAAAEWGPILVTSKVSAAVRRMDSQPASGPRWREQVLSGLALLYAQPGPGTVNTLVAGVRFDGRDNVYEPYQLTLGGEEGVRSYLEDEVPVQSRFVAFAEHRLNLPWFRPGLDVGLTLFGDIGQGWAGTTPFGVDTGWRSAIGGGLRLGFPAGTGSVTRVELAWPVGGPDAGGSPVFRTYWSPTPTRR